MNNRVARSIIVGLCFAVIGTVIFKDIFVGILLGLVWGVALLTGKKEK